MRRAKQTAERGGVGTNRLQVTWIQSIFRKVLRMLPSCVHPRWQRGCDVRRS